MRTKPTPTVKSLLIVVAMCSLGAVSSCGLATEPLAGTAGQSGSAGQSGNALQLDDITPTRGPTVGGINLAIAGANFAAGAVVIVGGEQATEVAVWSGTRITARLPPKPGFGGSAEVVVQNPDGQTATRKDLFRYDLGQLPFRTVILGGFSTAMAAGEFNGDGVPDLAAASDLGVQLFLSNGAGGYQGSIQVTAGTNPIALATADINGDNRLDVIAVNNGSDDVSVLLNDGLGNLTAKSYSVGPGPTAVAVLDWNGDHAPDLAIAHARGRSVSLLLGDGRGGFAAAIELPVDSSAGALAAGDWNRDGKWDLAVALPANSSISVLQSDGMRGTAATTSLPLGIAPSGITAADWNGDGTPDLIVVSAGSNNLNVVFGDGKGNFANPTSLAGAASAMVAVADFNGDNKPDLAVAGKVLFGDGMGGLLSSASHACASSFTIGDFNRDRTLDLACQGTSTVLLNDGAGNLGQPSLRAPIGVRTDTDPFQCTSVATDVNGDQRLDLLSCQGNTCLTYFGDGNGGFSSPHYASVPGCQDRVIATGDFDGDEKPDIICTGGGVGGTTSFFVSFGDGTGGFSKPKSVGGIIRASPVWALATGDFNGDGVIDFAASVGGQLIMFLNGGQLGFVATPSNSLPNGIPGLGMAVGDFDGDSRQDIAVVGASQYNWVGLYLGTMFEGLTFSRGISIQAPSGLAAGDFNGDGYADLAVSTFQGGNSVLLGSATAGLSAPIDLNLGTDASGVVSGDFNNDGKLDLYLRAQPDLVLWGDGTGSFNSYTALWVNSEYGVAGDFNNDGKLDLTVGQSLWLNSDL